MLRRHRPLDHSRSCARLGYLRWFAAFLAYMLSGQELDADQGIVARFSRYIPLPSLKIVIVVWQILTQVRLARPVNPAV